VKFFRFKSPEVAEKQSELKELIDKVIDDDHTYAEITTEIPQTSLKADICTRWNSIYTMIESLVKNRAVVHALLRNYGKNDLMFSCKEIKALQKLLSFLEPFKKAYKNARRPLSYHLACMAVCLLFEATLFVLYRSGT